MGNPYKNQKKPTVAPRATTAQAVFVPPPPQPSAPLRSMDQERAAALILAARAEEIARLERGQ